MLEGLAAWVLNNYIGEYVENLNTHQLSIGVFQGQVELENLPLKRDALKKLDLPLEVKSGFIGRIQLSIPVKRLKSEPWVITLDKLYLVAGPIQEKQYNEEEEKSQSLTTKQLQLKALEEKWKAADGVQSGGYMWSMAPMFTNILENIQLKVKDVHLRYEDNVTIPGSSFACGITIKSLSAQSADASWLPKFVSKYQADMMRKLVDLQEFSAYWDIDAEMIGDLTRSELEDALQRPMFKSASSGIFKEHEFLLEPVSAQAKMRRNTSDLPLRSANNPRVALDIQLDKIPISLGENQYRGMVAWMKEFARHEKRRKYRCWKPSCKVKDDMRAWWRYAIQANLHSIQNRNKRRTLSYLIQRCRDNCLYVDAYIDFIAIGTTYMEERLKEHMDYMEAELTFEELKVLREIGRVKMRNTVIETPPEVTPVTSVSPQQTTSGATSPQMPPDDATSPQQGQGLFQRWFPGWGGWYGGSYPSDLIQSPEDPDEPTSLRSETEEDFEQEVMDILNDTDGNNTLLKRDTVFAQLNFQLQSGIFKLLHDTGSTSSSGVLLEMECSQITMDFESRPRTNGMKFGISVGGLYLRDKMTANSIMPVLIAPQQRDRSSSHSRQLFTGVLSSGLGRSPSPLQPVMLGGSPLVTPQEQTLFELVYEKKPPQYKADYRLEIKTKPLDIVYNPTTITRVQDFFTVKKSELSSIQLELELAAAAKSRYEAIKKQTEEELKHTLDEMLEDDEKIKAKRWIFNLDIAAPQIIIPQNFTEINTTLVVFDLGHLQFQNAMAGIKEEIKLDDDDEEDFVTPSSTPPQKQEETVVKSQEENTKTMLSEIFSRDLSEAAIRDKIYDKYKLNLSDLQVMVGKAKDNWRYAHTKGTSHLHVVDKFSISLQFDRRLLYTSDPQWPKATIAGTLPSLILHFSEPKIRALDACAELLTESAATSPVTETPSLTDATQEKGRSDQGDQSMYYSVYRAYTTRQSVADPEDEHMTKQAVADSVHCLMQFSINQLSLEIQSRGRSIAELQVQGVNANFTMRPFDKSISFSIHSLLVVDALQTFGPDFELLVASHKNLSLDSQSGSMRDSEPNSPCSPQSPQSPSSPAEPVKPLLGGQKLGVNVIHAASSALQGLARTVNTLSPEVYPVTSPFCSTGLTHSTGGITSPSDPLTSDLYPTVNSDALIKMELDIISPNCPTNNSADETLHIANVQFNNLDFIANQQTLVELLGFFQRVMPSNKRNTRKSKRQQKEETDSETRKKRWELSAEFHRLNVLLMRVETEQGQKVATATMSEARVNVTVATGGLEAKGSLGSVQVQNLTQEAVVAGRHQKVLSIGSDPHDPDISDSASYHCFRSQDLYKTTQDGSIFEESTSDQALTITLYKPNTPGDRTPDLTFEPTFCGASTQDEMVLQLKMASLCYTHSPDFLKELSMCVTEFKDYMTGVGSTLKVAATEMAIGLVTHGYANMDGTTVSRTAGRRAPSMSELAIDPSFDSFSQSVEDVTAPDDIRPTVIKLDINLETPVILLPRKPDSPQVLVIHLGRISVRNFDHPTSSTFDESLMFQQTEDRDRMYIEVRDMSMYSVDLDKQKLLEQRQGQSTSVFHTPQPGGYIRTNYGKPILHDTILELTMQKMEPLSDESTNQNADLKSGDYTFDSTFEPFSVKSDSSDVSGSVLQVNGRLITPLKLTLSKDVYEQLLQTLDNITPTDDEGSPESPRSDVTIDDPSQGHGLANVSEEGIHSSVSALKLDESLSISMDKSTTSTKETVTKPEENLILKAYFEMPILNVKMTGDLGEGEQGLVDLKLENFKVNFEKADPWSKSIEISLQSLIMEDLLQEKDSKHRYLMVSTQKVAGFKLEETKLHMSQSCPTAMIDIPVTALPSSLPSSFHEDNVFGGQRFRFSHPSGQNDDHGVIRSKSASECVRSSLPPPKISEKQSQSDKGRLVHMKMVLVERRCPEFATKYKSTNRFIDVDFNGLDTTINLQTWVVLLDFLGMGAKVHNTDNYEPANQMPRSSSTIVHLASAGSDDQDEVVNSEIDLKVQSLSLILNKAEYELAKASVSRFDSHISLRDGTFAIKGQLGSMSLQDQSPHGTMYKERFTTTGNQALDFDIFKYGTPDPLLSLDHDISVKLRMNSVWYVHTQRFLSETLAFAENFNQLQDVLGRMRAASAGKTISEKAFRGSRIKIDIEAGAPILFIPHSSKSTDILVIDLGALSVHNRFLEAGAVGTISHRRKETKAAQRRSGDTQTPESTLSRDSSYVTCKSGLPPGQARSDGLSESMMSQSIYGSLEKDSRSSVLEAWESSSGTSDTSTLIGSVNEVRSTASLSSFYSSMGGLSLGGISSSIGGQTSPRSDGCVTVPRDQDLLAMIRDSSDLTVSLLAENHKCLLDVLSVELTEMDLFSAEWCQRDDEDEVIGDNDLVFPSYIVKREKGKVLRDKCRLTLQVERNLEGEISHSVPDFSIDGKLTSVRFQLDLKQYLMIRGLLAHNLGEDLDTFKTPMMSQLQDPLMHTVLSGNVWTGVSINLDLDGVTAELLIAHGDGTEGCGEVSLAKFEFITSRLSFDSFSDGSKDIDLVSHEIRVLDTRYRDSPVNVRPNVFPEILKPSVDRCDPLALQMELHYRSSKQFTRFTILLNNMRVMGIFDWLLACKDYLLTSPDDPHKTDDGSLEPPGSPVLTSSLPAAVSTGVLTKRSIHSTEKKEASFELRLNVTDTELVVVEDTTGRDTNAVILKSTAVFSYKPDFAERPVSCSLQSLEVFSCSLAAEDETALSIIDPMSITMELNGSPAKKGGTIAPTGLLDATHDVDSNPPVLEISFMTLNIRLSYNDLKLFLAIAKTVPDQLIQAKQQAPPPKNAIQCKYPVEQINKLENLGFTREDCEKALVMSQGQLDEAALWLTQNATPLPTKQKEQDAEGFSLSGFEVKAGAICLCFIDDCLDADVPLAELTFSQLTFLHRFRTNGQGKASFKLSGDFYNRSLSGWEPFIETWGCIMKWNQGTSEEDKLLVDINADQVLNVNITRTLLEQYQKTKVKWAEDYFKQQPQLPDESGYNNRKRVPFIPFMIRNETGCKLWFATMTTKPTRTGITISPGFSKDSSNMSISDWGKVESGGEMSFIFEEREKIRHKHTHELKTHQVAVQVEGWREVSAVSVDKVGTYFRIARPEVNPSCMDSLPPARIVFDVTQEGSARKVITVRSGLLIHNRLDDDVEVRLQNTLPVSHSSPINISPGRDQTIIIKQGTRQALPLLLVHSRIWLRPVGWSLDWCRKPIVWQHVEDPKEPNDSIKACTMLFSDKPSYLFCTSVYCQPFPTKSFSLCSIPSGNPGTGHVTGHVTDHVTGHGIEYHHPGHLITLMPPVLLQNLLPVDMTYVLKPGGQADNCCTGSIKPGKMAALVMADLTQNFELSISLDNMTTSKDLVVPPGTVDFKVRLLLFDSQDRPLELTVRIKAGIGGSLKLLVSVPYWLVNKTGLPLIFKQDGAKTSAGQFEEHELARSVTPLLFSYTEKERSFMCTMRLGKYIHGVNSKAMWTQRFSLERGSGVRELHVMPNDNRPNWVYMIGIEVRQGRGRYCDTNIVTCSPRYQLDNRSSHKLAFAQKYAVINWSPSSVDYFSALPNCTLSFHWPRVDKDNLLCVQLMNDPESQWSGGFRIDKVDSFHINIRSKDTKSTFLRVDVVLHTATYFVVLSDASHMPSPYRVVNYSEVPIVFYQTNTRHDLRIAVRPHSQVPYALDEPVLPPHITVKVLGGSSATYNLHSVMDGDQLYYENHIYLAFTGTFKTGLRGLSPRASNWGNHMEQHELVLDVLPNNRVVLRKREAGKRSQLWRMTSTSLLHHEGSAPPHDPGNTRTSLSSAFYVLDIADYQLRSNAEMGLAIRKAEDKRKLTQTWKFTRDGRLITADIPNLCVQAKGGFFGLRDGEDAVLGPSPPRITNRQDVPIEMAIHNEKSRPGSGQLSVRVLVDGPTRVLRISDVTQQRLNAELRDDWVLVDGRRTTTPDTSQMIKHTEDRTKMLELKIVLPEGIGLSLVNTQPEELAYISLRDIYINFFSSGVGQDLEISVNKFQIDNQLFGPYHPILLFVTQFNSHHDDEEDKGPALQISVHKIPSLQWNADIYKHMSVTMKRLTVQIEETLLWKLLQFSGYQQNDAEMQNISETGVNSIKEVTAATSAHLKRYYFGTLKIDIRRLMLSMLTANELSPDLKVLKRSLGIPLVKFADAQVDLEPFIRHHPFETSAFLIESILHHFTEEMKSQAASILGSVDFLGNPLGFFNDVAEGVSGLLEGNVGGLFKNITHGVSNSAAKVTGSLSDGLGVASLDSHHQKKRQQIRYASESQGGGSSGHLVAGLRGLGHGIFGGLTSIVSQTYTGVTEDGFEGFFTGFGKGVVGTVTKPVAGVLDFASGAASAVRDTSRSSSKKQPKRVRKPRVCLGPGGLLPVYSEELANGLEYLHQINDNDYSEICIAVDVLRGGRDDSLRALITNRQVFLLGVSSYKKEDKVLHFSFAELFNCRSVCEDGKHYIMLLMKVDREKRQSGEENTRSPLVRCDTEYIAQKVSQQVNYAKSLFDEVNLTLRVDTESQTGALLMDQDNF